MDHAPMPGAEGLAEPLRSRWSPSVFDATHELDADEVRLLLQAARWAPSRGNAQPWAFLVAPRGSTQHAALVATLSRGNAGWVPRAALVVVAAATEDDEWAAYAAGQAAAHLTLQARAMGLDAHQFAGYDREALAAAMGVPDDVRLLAGIAVGRHLDGDAAVEAGVDERDRERETRGRERRPLDEIAFGAAWGRPWTP